jgi:hypothetical protein
MLSTQYRLKLEEICNRIAKRENVELNEIIWAEKLAKANRTAGTILRNARRRAENPDMQEGDLDDFLNQLDIGNLGHERFGKTGFNSPDEIVDWFRRDDLDGEGDNDWRRRD